MIGRTLRLRILGTSFSVTSADAAGLDELHRLWAEAAEDDLGRGDPGRSDVELGADAGVAAPDQLRILTADLNRVALERYADFAAHAGVVAFGDRVVAVPAVSGTGKTTMAAACVKAGATYVSDEALCVRYADGTVQPYPKPLALSDWSARAVRLAGGVAAGDEWLTTAAGLGGSSAVGPLTLTDVVRLSRVPSRPAALDPVHRSDAIPLLLGMSFNHYRRTADSFALVTALARACRSWNLTYDDPNEAADVLAALPA